MNEINEMVNGFSATIACMALCMVICGSVARSRGYSVLFYGALAFFLSFGAIPLTLWATREPNVQEEPAELGFTPASGIVNPDPTDADLASWRRLYRAIRDSLLFGGLAGTAVAIFGIGFTVTSILPVFVSLFEGMSLVLPLPTRILIWVTSPARNPLYAPIFWMLRFTWPVTLLWLLERSGYWFPMLGPVWKAADRLWQIQATRQLGNHWRNAVPGECARRLGNATELALPEDEQEYQTVLRRQRDSLQIALWMLLPGAIPLVVLVLITVGLVGLGVFLPLYQLIGSVGG